MRRRNNTRNKPVSHYISNIRNHSHNKFIDDSLMKKAVYHEMSTRSNVSYSQAEKIVKRNINNCKYYYNNIV